MAKLSYDLLTLEIRFREFDDCFWVQYDVLFLWDGEPMVNDALLKRSPVAWADRGKATFRANESDGDSLLPVLKRVLDENRAEYWEPIEPDVILAFYPEQYFPFLPSHWEVSYEREDIKSAREERQQAKAAAGGRLPDDAITVIAFADAYQWRNCTAYMSNGLALVLCVRRNDIQRFHDELAQEYEIFRREWRIEERLRERAGAGEKDSEGSTTQETS